MDLGRYQLGQWVSLSFVSQDNLGHPTVPADLPVGLVTGPGGFSYQVPLSAIPESISSLPKGTAFSATVFLDAAYPLGIFSVVYAVGQQTTSQADSFTIVDGGDPGGRVVSMHAYDRPEATYIIGQLDSGLIVQGKNPRL